ncbi:MAG: hypothetical protein L0Z63_04815 [Actinobacteria bacterium]|nr:hypothetical protein [Actinomycetota bacterium]
MRVLVSASSKHGATTEIAERIGAVLLSAGAEVTVAPPDQIGDLAG